MKPCRPWAVHITRCIKSSLTTQPCSITPILLQHIPSFMRSPHISQNPTLYWPLNLSSPCHYRIMMTKEWFAAQTFHCKLVRMATSTYWFRIPIDLQVPYWYYSRPCRAHNKLLRGNHDRQKLPECIWLLLWLAHTLQCCRLTTELGLMRSQVWCSILSKRHSQYTEVMALSKVFLFISILWIHARFFSPVRCGFMDVLMHESHDLCIHTGAAHNCIALEIPMHYILTQTYM